MHEMKIFFIIIILISWWKPGILMPDLYLYSIKIQTDIDQNAVKTLQKNHRFFWNTFWRIFLGWAHVAGLDPASLVGSQAQASDPTGF